MAEQYKKKSAFLRFATWVDGRRVSAQRRQAVIDAGYRAFWVKKVRFGPGQQRGVTVRYSSTPGGDISGNSFVTYLFTGGNWRGTVDETILTVELHIPGTHLVSPGAQAKREGNRFSQRWTNWQGEDQFMFHYWPMPVPRGWMRIEGLRESSGPYGEVEVTVAGQQGGRTWNPPVLLVNGATFVRADALRNFLSQHAERAGHQRAAALSWDSAKKQATLQAGSYLLVFSPGRDEMLVSPDRRVRLAAAPFLGQPGPMHRRGALYVPARPVVEALGGTLRTDLSARRVHLDIPPFWEASRDAQAKFRDIPID